MLSDKYSLSSSISAFNLPKEEVSVSFNNETYDTQADDQGDWHVTLPSLTAGGPYTIQIKGQNQVTIQNILVGDVWLCSGQSNMELTMQRASPLYPDVIRNSENEYIRYIKVPYQYDFKEPQPDITEGGNWQTPNPETVLDFGAVAYFFGRELYEQYQVPIGLINSSMGGSPVEAWLSEDALKQFPTHYRELQKFKDDALIAQVEKSDQAINQAWHTKLKALDEGSRKGQTPWYAPELNTEDWSAISVPGFWADEELGSVNGVVWFRKEINLPSSIAGQAANLLLGRIVDSDSVYMNGTFVGTTGYQYPPRRYEIPAGILQEGKNTLAVRVINSLGRGGFVPEKAYQLSTGADTVDLTGEWQYQLGARMDPLPGQTFVRWKPSGLYNGMIAPLTNYRIKGAIWYQGESNTSNPEEYDETFPALIENWRGKWNQEEFPFLFVQLANFMEAQEQPQESQWARLREAQRKTLSVLNTAMAVTTDIGEWNDIHPLNKEDVGKRLALAAQHVAYGNDSVVYSGPVYENIDIEGSKAILTFSSVGGA